MPCGRGRQGIFDASAGVASKHPAATAISAASKTSEIIAPGFKTVTVFAPGKFAPAGFAPGQISEQPPVQRASAKHQAGHLSNVRLQVFHHATAPDQIQRQSALLAPAAIKVIRRRRRNRFSFPNCGGRARAGSCPPSRNRCPRRTARPRPAAISTTARRRTAHSCP